MWIWDNILYYTGMDQTNSNTEVDNKETSDKTMDKVAAAQIIQNIVKQKMENERKQKVENLKRNISALKIQNFWLYRLKLKKRIELRKINRINRINLMEK